MFYDFDISHGLQHAVRIESVFSTFFFPLLISAGWQECSDLFGEFCCDVNE